MAEQHLCNRVMYDLTIAVVMASGVVPMVGMVKLVARAADDMPDTCIVAL